MNIIQKAATPLVFRITPPQNITYATIDLKQKAVEELDSIKLNVSKALQNADGSISPITGISDQLTEIEVILNGMCSRNNRGTVAQFMGWTCGAVTLPGLPTKLTVFDDNGQPLPDKKDDAAGFNEDTVYVEFVWDEGSQTGELRRYSNSQYDVRPGTMTKVFPVDSYGDDKSPVPTGCHAPVDESSINN